MYIYIVQNINIPTSNDYYGSIVYVLIYTCTCIQYMYMYTMYIVVHVMYTIIHVHMYSTVSSKVCLHVWTHIIDQSIQ